MTERSDIVGVINIRKEKGCTSHDVVNIVRKALGGVKAGHTGTLDPAAEGVLPICIGKATKIADYISSDTKGYRAELILGANTDTQDDTGTVIKTFPVDFNEENIIAAMNSFIGGYMQTPPMYSALKVNGQKLYKLARKGVEIERQKRRAEIYNIKILEFRPPNRVIFETTCSKGTYIRALCEDIGAALSQGGHMGELVRFRAGNFYLEDSIKINDFLDPDFPRKTAIIPIEKVLSGYETVYVKVEAEKLLYNGNKIPISFTDKNANIKAGDKALAKDSGGNLTGVYLVEETCIKPVVMLV